MIRQFSAWYLDRGLRAGDAVTIDAGSGELAIPAVFGAMAIGVVPLCLPPDATPELRRRSAERVGAKLELRGGEDPGAVSLRSEGLLSALRELEPLASFPDLPVESDAAILFSSGTTGVARACRISHRALHEAARLFPDLRAFAPSPRVLVVTTIHTITGLRFALPVQAMHDAASVWLPPSTPAPLMMAAAARLRCQAVSAGPGFVGAVLRELDRVESSILPGYPALVWAGGGAVSVEERRLFSRRLGVSLIHAYGLTETCGTLGCWTLSADGVESWRTLDEVEIRIEFETPGAPFGAVLVRTPAAFSGYLSGGGPVMRDGALWVDTGDVGRIHADGKLELRGRQARMFTAADGEKVLLDEVEAALGAVSGGPAHVGVLPGERPALAALVEQPAPWCPAQERALRERLPARARPVRVMHCEKLPINASGKIDRARCQRILEGA